MNAKNLDDSIDRLIATTVDNLLSELATCRRQSEHLKKINSLYQRMSGVLDLPTMLETYSIWLSEHVRHELIGYRNPSRQRMHMFCSCHGPKRRLVISVAEGMLTHPLEPEQQQISVDGLSGHRWTFESTDCFGMLVLIRKGDPLDEDELYLVDNSLLVLAEPLKRALEYEEIFAQARKDPLTGLPNRFVFDERIDELLEQAHRYQHPLTLASIDLDHFKSVNDSMGHLIGDRVLQQVAGLLQQHVRTTDLLARMGGDEFMLLLPNTDIFSARVLAERLCQAVDRLGIDTPTGRLALSIGLAEWQPGLKRQEWLERADDILYQAKANGRNQVAIN
jgi:diguanylate cyclase (GGDEF)-like protein